MNSEVQLKCHHRHHPHHHHHPNSSSSGNSSSSSTSSTGSSVSAPTVNASVEHSATVEKGLKMKIKRKNIGGKSCETKHEIVSSDITAAKYMSTRDHNSVNSSSSSSSAQGMSSTGSASSVISSLSSSTSSDSKSSKHSNKGRSGSHKDKKDKNRDRERSGSCSNSSSSANTGSGSNNKSSTSLAKVTATATNVSANEVNGLNSNCKSSTDSVLKSNPSSVTPNSNSPLNGSQNSRLATPSGMTAVSSNTLTLKYSSASLNPTVILRTDELTKNIPSPNKKIKLEAKIEENISATRDTGTSTSVGTITEPDCLGPCEPGTSVTLEGIVWQETEGGVLVVNVTWRGKTYVGTLLDCTRHDWAPPRFCESPTSDIESKTNKNSRGKRSRGSNLTNESVTDNRIVQSKLRNGKGRRTANSGFTVPASPAKSDSNAPSSKRKGRPSELELSPISDNSNNGNNKGSKRNRSQTRNTPATSEPNTSVAQPSSPILIECPEPNCSKKYKHINGLKYHQTHAHCNDSNNTSTEVNNSKDNTSDNEENNLDSGSRPSSPAIKTDDMAIELNDNLSSIPEQMDAKNDSVSVEDSDKTNSKFSSLTTNCQSFGNSMTNTGNSMTPTTTMTTTTSTSSTNSLAMSANTFLVSNQSSVMIDQNSTDQSDPKIDTSGDTKTVSTTSLPNVRPLSSLASLGSIASGSKSLVGLNESNSISPKIEGIKKDKSKHKKKNKEKDRDKDKEKKFPTSSAMISVLDNKFCQTLESTKMECDPSEGTTTVNAPIPEDIYSGTDLNPSKGRPLSAELPLKIRNSPNNSIVCPESDTTDNKISSGEASIENVRSPAYSDISDANDTTTAIDCEDMEVIDKPEDNLSIDKTNVEIQSQSSPNFRLYPYFNQSQYILPVAAPEPQRSSASLPDTKSNESDFPLSIGSKRSRGSSDQSDKSRSEEVLANVKLTDALPLTSNSPAENMQEFGSLNPIPYPFSYMQRYSGYPMDPNYHMHLLTTDPHYKEQFDRYIEQERVVKEQSETKDRLNAESNQRLSPLMNKSIDSTSKQSSSKSTTNLRLPSLPAKTDGIYDSNLMIKEKQNENRQILKENIELKSQMDANNKRRHNSHSSLSGLSSAPFEPMFDRHREEQTKQSKRYFMDNLIEHQNKPDLELHSSTGIGPIGPPPLLKDNMSRPKSETTKSSISSSSHKHSSSPSLSSPKPKDNSKKDKSIDEKDDKSKIKLKEEGVKPTMETTGPPPPPTNGYYFNPSYLPPHFSPFDHSHPMFRAGSMSPVMMGNPYSGQYLPPQLRYHMSPVAPPSPIGSMDIPGPPINPSHPPNEPMVPKIHPNGPPPPKNIDILHPVSHFGTHKIHELQERALISPTGSTTGPHHMQTPSKTVVNTNIPAPNGKSIGSVVSDSSPGKDEPTDGKGSDRQRSPPPQRHLHTHHHTHVGVGYPIYDPYSAMIVSHSSTSVPMHPFVPK